MSTHEHTSAHIPTGSDNSEQDIGATLKKQGIIIGVIAVVILVAALFGVI